MKKTAKTVAVHMQGYEQTMCIAPQRKGNSFAAYLNVKNYGEGLLFKVSVAFAIEADRLAVSGIG